MDGPQSRRLPPGQRPVESWPVLHLGEVPAFDPSLWSLRVEGAVTHPLRLAWRDVLALQRVERRVDLHAATGWSALDLPVAGVHFEHLLRAVEPQPRATHVLASDGDGYSAAVELEVARQDALLVLELAGRPLAPEHGGPLRWLVPSRFGWKSVKWLRALLLLDHDEPGTWERRGAHPRGDPFRSERQA